MQARNGSIIFPKYQSANKYSLWLENNLAVLPDEKTVIGYNKEFKQLLEENLTETQSSIVIDCYNLPTLTVLFNKELNILLVGYTDGTVIQYSKEFKWSWKKQIQYGNIKIGKIYSSDQLGWIAVMGGNRQNRENLRMINLKERKVLQSRNKASFEMVFSLCFGVSCEKQILLSVGGRNPDYLNDKTNVFDVTLLFKHHKVIDMSKLQNSKVQIPEEDS